MKRQELDEKLRKLLVISNYSEQTIISYESAIHSFLNYIQELFGHKRIETTQICTHISSYSINKIKSPADMLDI